MKIQQLKNIIGAGMLSFAEDTDSLNVAKNTIEGITNLTYLAMENFENTLRFVAKLAPALIILRTITKQMAANVQQGALAIEVFGTAAQGAGGTSAVLQGLGLAAGKGVEGDDLSEFGMRAFKGSRISAADKIAGFVPGFIGSQFGLQTGKSRRQSDAARRAYFTARPGADMFMRGIDPKEHFQDAFEAVQDVGGKLLDAQGNVYESTEDAGKALINYYEQVAHMNMETTGRLRGWAHRFLAKREGRILGATDATKDMAFDGKGMKRQKNLTDYLDSVSYTHMQLPTIYSV